MSYLGLSAKRCELFTGASAIGSGSNRPGFETPDLQLSSGGLDLFEQLTTGAHSAAAALFLAAQFAGGDVGQQGVGVDLAGVPAAVVGLEQNLGLQGARPPVIRWGGPYGAVVPLLVTVVTEWRIGSRVSAAGLNLLQLLGDLLATGALAQLGLRAAHFQLGFAAVAAIPGGEHRNPLGHGQPAIWPVGGEHLRGAAHGRVHHQAQLLQRFGQSVQQGIAVYAGNSGEQGHTRCRVRLKLKACSRPVQVLFSTKS